FRTDLRLRDSPAALDLDPAVLWPIFTWDPHYISRARRGLNRRQFPLDCQNDLSQSITRLNAKSKLPVLREALQTLLPKLFRAWNVTHLVFEKDTDSYARARDEAVVAAAKKAGVEVHHGKPTMSMSQLQVVGRKVGDIPRPIPAPDHLPDPGEMPVDFEQHLPDTEPDFNPEPRTEKDTGYSEIAGPTGDFAIETMRELGLASATTPHRGGESVALRRLDDIIKNEKYTATFQKPKTNPAQFEPQRRLVAANEPHGPAALPRHELCRPGSFGSRDAHTGLATGEYHVDSHEAETWFKQWKAGVTGSPWIDALMRQLREEGWTHHLGRHSVACFFTRGGCYVDWERGADVFEEYLLDHEPACNAGNWQWLSCTAFFAQYYRCYSPVSFGQKWDKQGVFIRHWVPELRDLDATYIYEPWKAPIQDQRKAGVRATGLGLGCRRRAAKRGRRRIRSPSSTSRGGVTRVWRR
ncbi:Cryptochrome-1, partial [Tolypocladium paradoxum]